MTTSPTHVYVRKGVYRPCVVIEMLNDVARVRFVDEPEQVDYNPRYVYVSDLQAP